ncbi:MAG: hypothetical protein AAFZ09_00400 [Pseudomonadota bacterium]
MKYCIHFDENQGKLTIHVVPNAERKMCGHAPSEAQFQNGDHNEKWLGPFDDFKKAQERALAIECAAKSLCSWCLALQPH